MADIAALTDLIEPEARALGFDLVRVKMFGGEGDRTLQVMAERFSSIGVPVFMADVKGDLSGLSAAGTSSPKMAERLKVLKLAEPEWRANPVVFWDAFGQAGHPVRATISDMGPLLLGRLFNLNDTQQGVLSMVFKIADDHQLLLIDLKDLRALLTFLSENAKELSGTYGNVSGASIGAIQRGLLEIDQQGADRFFGEPALNIMDFIQTDAKGRGIINILAALFFVFSGTVAWQFVPVMAAASLVGGNLGGRLVGVLKPSVLRVIVIVFGVAAAVKFFL